MSDDDEYYEGEEARLGDREVGRGWDCNFKRWSRKVQMIMWHLSRSLREVKKGMLVSERRDF